VHQIHVTQVLRFGGFFTPNRKSKRAVAQVTRTSTFHHIFSTKLFSAFTEVTSSEKRAKASQTTGEM